MALLCCCYPSYQQILNFCYKITYYKMGICPLSPELRVLQKKNVSYQITQQSLTKMLLQEIKDMQIYSFQPDLVKTISNMPNRYLLTDGMLEDIDRIRLMARSSTAKYQENSFAENIDDQYKNSCLILENEVSIDVNTNDQTNKTQENMCNSFQNNLKKHQSLVVQINIMYGREIKRDEYSRALSFFLKWAQLFQEHSFGGFLKPLYKSFCKSLYQLPLNDFETIVDEVGVFVYYIVKIVTQVYDLKAIAQGQNGKLFKNDNIYNLIMSYLFKRTRIKKFLISSVVTNNSVKIALFQQKLNTYHRKTPLFFGVSKKFILTDYATETEINKSMDSKDYVTPYHRSLKLVEDLCKSTPPVTKLKTIISISKQILNQIRQYYKNEEKEAPEIDPDNLSSIVMYLIVKNNNKSILEQLKIVQSFTQQNCMNCISGYYLNIFNAAIQSILALD